MADSAADPYWGRPEILDRAGSQIHYWVVGPVDGPLVALTHGASMDHRMFDPQLAALTAAGYRVLAWDVRGHGISKPMGGEFTVPAVAADLFAVVDAVGGEAVTLVGHSFGGYVSQEVLFRRPERVAALVTIGSMDVMDLPPRLVHAILRISPALFRIWPDSRRRRLVAKYTGLSYRTRRYAYNATSQLSKREFVRVWKAVATCHRQEPDYRIPCPFLLTHGEADRVGPIARSAPDWAARHPGCRYEVVPEAGHNANQDNPGYFNDVLLDFLSEHAPVE